MSQSYNDNCYDPDAGVQSDMAKVEANFAALKSCFSGASAPANPVAGMLWYHTSKGLRVRTSAEWLKILQGDGAQKMWVYRNAACEGWLILTTVTDRVLAVKGGGSAYDVAGGSEAGTWQQPGHTLTAAEMPEHTHVIDSDSHNHNFSASVYAGTVGANGAYGDTLAGNDLSSRAAVTIENDSHNHTAQNAGSGNSHNHGTGWRPAAAVGTIQYPDMT